MGKILIMRIEDDEGIGPYYSKKGANSWHELVNTDIRCELALALLNHNTDNGRPEPEEYREPFCNIPWTMRDLYIFGFFYEEDMMKWFGDVWDLFGCV